MLTNATSTFEGLGASISISDIAGYVVELFSEVWVLVAFAIGIPLAFYLVRKFIQLLPGR